MSAGAGWLIETKFSPAARGRRQIERDRILAAIAGGDHRLVVVQAAAGFGKSTLLGQWAARAEEGGAAVAWLNLDEDDREPDQFVAYLVEALRRVVARRTADSTEAFAGYAGLPARAAVAAVIHEVERRESRVALVLDDYHRAESEAVDGVTRSLLLDAAERQAGAGTPLARRITARALRALLEARRGRRDRALAALTVATGLAGSEPFARTLPDEGDDLRDLAEELSAAAEADAPIRRRFARLRNAEARATHGEDERPAGDFGLSPREHEILDLPAEGLSNKEIARRIARDPNTVKYHLKSLFAKLAVERRGRAVVRARDIGLIR